MTNENQAVQNATRALNQMINNDPTLRSLFGSNQASYVYYSHKGSKDEYFYTTQRVKRLGALRYVSGVYRYVKTQKMWKPLKQAGHATKRGAIARAKKLWQAKA